MKRILASILILLLLPVVAGCADEPATVGERNVSEATQIDPETDGVTVPPSAKEEAETEPQPEPLKQPDIMAESAAELLVTDETGVVPISRAEQIMALSAMVNSGDTTHHGVTFVLQRNISLKGYDFIPIGGAPAAVGAEDAGDEHSGTVSDATMFNGIFDGAGYIISGVTVRDSGNKQGTGLFGRVGTEGIVRNLHLTGGNIAGTDAVGGLAGIVEGVLYNCSFNGSVNAAGAYTGGLAGKLSDSAVVSCCFVNSETAGWGGVGGLAGFADEDVTVFDSYALGKVTARLPDGESCESKAAGGFVGDNAAEITRCFTHIEVYTYVADSAATGGFIGSNTGTVADCYYNKTATENWPDIGVQSAEAEAGLTPCTVEELLNRNTYKNWDFGTIWEIDGEHNRGLPFLRAAELY